MRLNPQNVTTSQNGTITEKNVGDQDGLLVEEINFTADRGADGSTDEIFLGFV